MSKPRLVRVTDPAELRALDAKAGELGAPKLVQEVIDGVAYNAYYCDADELRLWRAAQHTSGGKS